MFNKKLMVLLITSVFIIVMINNVGATTLYFGDFSLTQEQDTCFNIPMSCDNCTYMNITVLYPNGTAVIENQEMTNLSSDYFYNYTFCNTSTLGIYWVVVNYDDDGEYVYTDGDFFEVTPNGVNLTMGRSILYIGILFILFIFLIISIIGTFNIENYIGKFTLYWCSHLLFTLYTFSVWQITEGFLIGFVGLGGIFKVLFYFSIFAVLPMIILSGVWIFYIHAFNEHFQKLLDKGEDPETAFAMAKKKRGGWMNGQK